MKPNRIEESQQSQSKKYIPPKEIKPEHQEFFRLVGVKLHEIRKAKKISASKLVREVGISRNGYHQMESGKVYFNIHTLIHVLDYHNITINEFLKRF